MSVTLLGNGRLFDLMSPSIGDMDLPTMAHALSNICRYAGHTKRFYSVAEHCCRVASMVGQKHKLCALMHDATETFVSDIPSPIKDLFPEIRLLETSLWFAIGKRYPLPTSLPVAVHRADKEISLEESAYLLPRMLSPSELGIKWVHKVPMTARETTLGDFGWPPEEAKKRWLAAVKLELGRLTKNASAG